MVERKLKEVRYDCAFIHAKAFWTLMWRRRQSLLEKQLCFFETSTRCKRSYFLYDLVNDLLSAPPNQRSRAPGLVLNLVEKLLHTYLQITNILWPSGQTLCIYSPGVQLIYLAKE